MLPIVCVVGKSKAGKTTLIERLVGELKRRGFRVATIKHDIHGFDLDLPGKDSWRHAQAGSDAVVISSPQRLALLKRVNHDSTLDELRELIGLDYDIVLAEGFKKSKGQKIEVHRREASQELLCAEEELLAMATDEPLDLGVPQYPLEDAPGLVDLLEKRFLTPREEDEERVALFINRVRVPLNPFARHIIARTALGMVSALKRVEEPESLELSVRRKL